MNYTFIPKCTRKMTVKGSTKQHKIGLSSGEQQNVVLSDASKRRVFLRKTKVQGRGAQAGRTSTAMYTHDLKCGYSWDSHIQTGSAYAWLNNALEKVPWTMRRREMIVWDGQEGNNTSPDSPSNRVAVLQSLGAAMILMIVAVNS